jgi:prepilin-type N-terminal cleavage/methylation domain-containing protein
MSRSIRKPGGFTLLEVMIGLALLGFALTILIKSAAGSMASAKQAQMIGVVTDLTRGKMYDIEELLIKDGFSDTDTCPKDKTFEEEGWPDIKYTSVCDQVELPSFDQLQAMSQGKETGSGSGGSGSGAGSGSGLGSSTGNSFQDSALGGMLAQMGGGFSGGSQDIDSKAGASFIQMYYQMVQETLKASIRKVTLTVTWNVMGDEKEMKTVAYFTDAPAMDKVLRGLGSQEPAGSGTGTGSGSGSGRGSGSGSGSGIRPGGTGSGSGVRK